MKRRDLLRRALGAAALPLVGAGRGPALVLADVARPSTEWGAAVGDVTGGRALVWSRTDRPSRLVVEYATTEALRDPRRVVGPAALEDEGFTARVDLGDLPAGQRIFYRALFQDLADLRTWSLPATGSFTTPPPTPRNVSFVWGGDVVGQGWGINPEWGGLRMFETMRRAQPDFFVHSGDSIYADNPLRPEVKLDDGSTWKNLVTPAKAKVAETLEEFRGNFLYNLQDDNLRRFNAEIPVVAQWDDHEVRNNWFPSQVLDDPRYQVKSVALLAARAKKAFLEYMPIRLPGEDRERVYRKIAYGPNLDVFVLDMRTYRGPNSANRQTALTEESAFLGLAQLAWLERELAASRATWKVIASDMPIGLVIQDGPAAFEAVANGDGPPLGRELEIAHLLSALRKARVRNVVWITADVHYAAAHHFDPRRARFTDFDPFWEFVAGPLHAGTFGPNALDDTFGPEVRFRGIPEGMKPNRPPSEGLQFYGRIQIEGRSRVLTASLHDLAGARLFGMDLEPQGVPRAS
jgi:alkaline phosphatase D